MKFVRKVLLFILLSVWTIIIIAIITFKRLLPPGSHGTEAGAPGEARALENELIIGSE